MRRPNPCPTSSTPPGYGIQQEHVRGEPAVSWAIRHDQTWRGPERDRPSRAALDALRHAITSRHPEALAFYLAQHVPEERFHRCACGKSLAESGTDNYGDFERRWAKHVAMGWQSMGGSPRG